MAGIPPGLQPDELAWDHGGRIRILLIARPVLLERCESPYVTRLASPASVREVIDALEALIREHRDSLPRRSPREAEAVEAAKRVLMDRCGITEVEAHRLLQRHAMDRGMKMADAARRIAAGSDSTGPG